ncbi:MAG TPA: aminodeoxychorismate lyase [Pseudomonadales bacterium]|nr:aminodeoxychorismate lyase [Pseudomonadales bacterium]
MAYGDGVFETMRVHDGNIPLWSFHLKRLRHALATLHIDADVASIEKDSLSLAAQHKSGVLKLTVARSGGGRGYDARTARDVATSLRYFPAPVYSKSRQQDGVRLYICQQRLSWNPVLAGIKHLNRLDNVLAASEWNRDWADEGLLLDNSGAVIEGTMSNLFVVRHGSLATPSLSHCGVAGVMRALIMQELAKKSGFALREMRLTLADVLSADECFVCNSIFGIWPVRSIGVSAMPDQKPASMKLISYLQSYGYGDLYV